MNPHVNAEVISPRTRFLTHGTGKLLGFRMDSLAMFRQSTLIRKTATTDLTLEGLVPEVATLVGELPLLAFEGFRANSTAVGGLGAVDQPVGI